MTKADYNRAYRARLKVENPERLRSYGRRHYLKHRDKLRAQHAAYNAANKDRLAQKKQEWAERNRVKSNVYKRNWALRNAEKNRQLKTAWAIAHPDVRRKNTRASKLRNRERRNAEYRERWKTDPDFALRVSLRCRIRSALADQGTYKKSRTESLLGCDIAQFKLHLERQFQPGMTWANRGEWHIDHIQPCCTFKLTDPEQQKRCFHFSNLQPLWGVDNLRKGIKPMHLLLGKRST